MGSLNVNMPDELREYVDHRTRAGGFGTPTEFIRHLIRKDKEAETEREIEALLLEGLKSGKANGDMSALFSRLHKRVDELAKQRQGKRGAATRSKATGGPRSR